MKSVTKKQADWQGSPESVAYRPGIGPFLWLLVLTALGIASIGFLLWYIPTKGLGNIHPALPYILGGLVFFAGLFVLAGAAIITAAAINGRITFYSPWLRWMLVKLFLPIMVMFGGIIRIPKIKIEGAFIDINNQMVRLMNKKKGGVKPEKLLLLMPHCIQFDDCKIKVTRNVRNCAGCGKCEIGNLVSLCEEFGIDLFISTGGTSARKMVLDKRPHAVVAVACERDLTSGLQDAYPLPVIGIVNKRPQGYCMETGVDLQDVRRAIVDLVA
ncbi:MAG: DUF116 domain-containing protein [Thermodesulfobacteriota bacterium]